MAGLVPAIHVSLAYDDDGRSVMRALEDIKLAVAALPVADFARFREWLEELSAERFDAAIAKDIKNGKLDVLAAEALLEVQKIGCQTRRGWPGQARP